MTKQDTKKFEVAKQAEAAGCRLRRALGRDDKTKIAAALAQVIAAGEAARKLSNN